MFQEIPINVPGVFAVKASGKLTDEDYQAFLPRLDALISEHGKISLLVELEDFEGWEAKAAWDDLDFGLDHDRDFDRIAIVGDKSWQHWMIVLSSLFMHTPLRFFPREETARALGWLSEGTQGDEPVTAYRHIVLATDFSAHSRRAARRASEIAGRYGSKLSLLHVVEDLALHDDFYDPVVPSRDQLVMQEMARARTRLDELAQDLKTIEGVEVRCAVLRGVPKSTILGYAHKQGADLVVVGSHGRRGARHLLGSVADAVSHGASCDVLTIRL